MAHKKRGNRWRSLCEEMSMGAKPSGHVAPRWDEEYDEPDSPADGVNIHRVRRYHRKRLVDFAVMLDLWMSSGWQQIARFDAAHGTVHRHRFRPHRPQEIETYQEIDRRWAEKMLQRWFERCWKMMDNDWWDLLEEWTGETD